MDLLDLLAAVAELADAQDLGSCVPDVWVQVPSTSEIKQKRQKPHSLRNYVVSAAFVFSWFFRHFRKTTSLLFRYFTQAISVMSAQDPPDSHVTPEGGSRKSNERIFLLIPDMQKKYVKFSIQLCYYYI